MRQHTVTTEGDNNRKYWGNLREQARRKARKDIRQRVLAPSPATTATTAATTATTSHLSLSNGNAVDTTITIPSLLLRVVKDDRSYFSVQSMNEIGALLLETPISSQYLLESSNDNKDNNSSSRGQQHQPQQPLQQPQPHLMLAPQYHEQFISWFGPKGYNDILWYATRYLTSFTLLEFAVWTRRYYVVGALLLGGINPCLRGLPADSVDVDTNTSTVLLLSEELKQLGSSLVLPRFFRGVPLSLSSYVVKRVVDMRRYSYEYYQQCRRREQQQDTTKANTNGGGDSTCCSSSFLFFDCEICQRKQLPMSAQLRFIANGDDHDHDNSDFCCSHSFCELCFWKDLVEHLEDRMGDVVLCPLCAASTSTTMVESDENSLMHHQSCCTSSFGSSLQSPVERRLESLKRFQRLPANAAGLKAISTSRKRKKKSAALTSTWSKAVRPTLGLTQDVRRDKFWLNLELGSYHYVRMCLELGANVMEQNQYGQTPLYLAAWRGDVRILRLLLEYYDSKIDKGEVQIILTPANGGSTAIGAAKTNNHTEIVQMLQEHFGGPDVLTEVEQNSNAPLQLLESFRITSSSCSSRACFPKLSVLIDPSFDHPGAGSYMLDDCLAPQSVDALCRLWATLPTEVAVKKKKKEDVPCSTRRYFCDAEKHISTALVDAVGQFFPREECGILPHMRYLCYSEDGAVLAPHVDLPRVDPFTNERSTHTFLLYLTDCDVGGATTLLFGMTEDSERNNVLARVQPKQARLFLFPHDCPHEGERVDHVPKLLIRGEARLPGCYSVL